MPRRFVPVLALCVLVAAACSSSKEAKAPATSGAKPSPQAVMVCAKEAQIEIQSALSAPVTKPVKGIWKAPDYSCTYQYAQGSFTLTVRDEPNAVATQAYFNDVVVKHGRKATANIGADQAALLKDGWLVARKKLHVLVVDVSKMPATFGQPPESRADTAYTIGGVIMACWTGAT